MKSRSGVIELFNGHIIDVHLDGSYIHNVEYGLHNRSKVMYFGFCLLPRGKRIKNV